MLLVNHLRIRVPATRLVAVTVDHVLRPDSVGEALVVSRLARSLGVEHRTLRWEGDKPAAGIAAAARQARYRLLAQAARDVGSDLIFAGHTADDQAETVAMREARGAGLGLAGMADVTLLDGSVWLARPFLGHRRQALRDILESRGLRWIDDPSNDNPAAERVRVRKALAGNEQEHTRLLDLAAGTARQRIALSNEVASLVARHASMPHPGLLHLRAEIRDAGEAALAHVLATLVALVGGRAHLPDAEAVSHLVRAIRVGPHRATLSRALIASRKDGVWMARETRGLPPIELRDAAIWDGRFLLTHENASHLPPTSAGPDLPATLLRAAEASQPAIPENWAATPVLSLWREFLPGFDLPLARAIGRLFGLLPMPRAPLTGHSVTSA